MQLQDIFNWMISLGVQYGYFGVFALSLLGSLSILFPIPDSLAVFALASLNSRGTFLFEPIWIALAAAVGSTIGEFSGYLLGVGARSKITGRYKKNTDFLVKVFNRFGAFAIFIFALTPLPDDLIFIPLGVMRYNPVKAILPALAGKLGMGLIVAYGGRYSLEFIQDVFGLGGDLISSTLIFAVGLVLTIVLFKVDWENHFGKYLDKYLSKPKKGQKLDF